MRLFPVVAAALLLAAYACSDYDAAEPPSPSPIVEAGADTAPPVDAGSDAVVEAGPLGFCAAKGDAAVFCEDFDSITDVSSLVPSSSVGEPSLTSQTFVSGPRSLAFLMPAKLDSPQYTVFTHGVVTDSEVRFEVDWRWQASTIDEGQTIQSLTLRKDVGQVAFGRACGSADAGVVPCSYYLSVYPDVGNQAVSAVLPLPTPKSQKAWSHVAFQVRFATNGHVRYEEDGVVLVDQDTATLSAPSTSPTSATIGVAILQGITTYQEMFFDNMVLELR